MGCTGMMRCVVVVAADRSSRLVMFLSACVLLATGRVLLAVLSVAAVASWLASGAETRKGSTSAASALLLVVLAVVAGAVLVIAVVVALLRPLAESAVAVLSLVHAGCTHGSLQGEVPRALWPVAGDEDAGREVDGDDVLSNGCHWDMEMAFCRSRCSFCCICLVCCSCVATDSANARASSGSVLSLVPGPAALGVMTRGLAVCARRGEGAARAVGAAVVMRGGVAERPAGVELAPWPAAVAMVGV